MNILYTLWDNYGIAALAVSVLAWLLTYAVKIPYKLLTGLIKDNDFRHLANVPVSFIPIGLAIGLWYGYNHFFGVIGPLEAMLLAGVLCGVAAIIIYFALGARIEAALKKVIKSKKLAAAVCSTDDEKAEMNEIVEKVKTSDNPVKEARDLFKRKAKEAKPEDAERELKKALEKYLL